MTKLKLHNSDLEKITNEYKPTRKEVFSETGLNIGKYVKENAKDFLKVNSLLYFAPTTLKTYGPKNKSGKFGENSGIISVATQGIFYFTNMINVVLPNNELWKIPLATNFASGLYEIGKIIYKKQKRKQLKKQYLNLENNLNKD